MNDPSVESSFCCQRTTKNYWSIDSGYNRILPWMKHYSSRQIRSSTLREDTGRACATRASFIRKSTRIGDNIVPIVTDHPVYDIDIHTAFDVNLLNSTLCFLKDNNRQFYEELTHGLS